ncbi:glycosyltransferase [Cytophagaceae bacterium ABcell3]|nr:glycosyltransferase [Cytophagaceae bacterium ABcell3]
MKILLFYHSLLSDWNHGNAHFLRGIATELINRGHNVQVFEPENGWSLSNLKKDYGNKAVEEFYKYYPQLETNFYNHDNFNYEQALKDADLVIVHEWNEQKVVSRLGKEKSRLGYKLLFHDTHHRIISDKEAMAAYDLSQYDGVLAYGEVIRKIYEQEHKVNKSWTWHEAADTNIFRPLEKNFEGDLVWVGNWGDEERTEELHEFLINPVKSLKLKAKIYGVRYPKKAIEALENAGIEYGGWLPNYKAPEAFSKYKVTVHVPRRPYVETLPGIPTIRPFEALACGIPLISSPWEDTEHLFRTNQDYLMVKDGAEMKNQLQHLIQNKEARNNIAQNGLETIQKAHTCKHRVDELEAICEEIGLNVFETLNK